MNKADLIAVVAERAGTPKVECGRVVNALLDAIADNLAGGVAIAGFGVFKTVERKARVSRNPQTGAQVEVPAKSVPVFRPAKQLKDAVKDRAKDAVGPAA